jgi:hypothetical protein
MLLIAERAKGITRFAEIKKRDKLKPRHSLVYEQSDSEIVA